MNTQLYYYHIITCADIEKELEIRQAYPIVHEKNETCETRCARTDTGTGRNDKLESIPGSKNAELCPGAEGVGEFEGDGSFGVQWNNGRRRRYSIGRGSCERMSNDAEGMGGRVRAVGTYIPSTEGTMPAIYNGPYKLIVIHQGLRRRHWHLIYVSNNKQWGFNSRLGRIIRAGTYKNSSINCLPCLREYLYSGNGRQVLQDILSQELVETCQCARHSCGMDGIDKWTNEAYEIECAEGGDSVYGDEGSSPTEEHEGLVDAVGETSDGRSRKRSGDNTEVYGQNGKILHGRKNGKQSPEYGKNWNMYNRNTDIILLLCQNSAFSESEAMEVLARTPAGIEFICSKQYAERIKNYVHIARILVFQEPLKQRFERAKAKFIERHGNVWTDEYMDTANVYLKSIVKENGINLKLFAEVTFKHLQGKTGKRNNLFFIGPPSTGKTMIMTSLAECQFNFCRLTGLTPNSSFNFSGLLHSNACLMDECKLTENQFEQWKLLASGMPMSTDVKYKDRCDVQKCVLYTCSNYPIEMYCKVPMAKAAIDDRTFTFEFKKAVNGYLAIPPHTWEKLWNEHHLFI